jgi:hypothetical protein
MSEAISEIYGLGDRAVARRSDPDTSHDAAASVTRISEMQALIVQVLEICGPLSDTALRGHVIDHTDVRISDSGLRTRRRELVEMGKVRDSGQRVTLPTGRQSIVWCLA